MKKLLILLVVFLMSLAYYTNSFIVMIKEYDPVYSIYIAKENIKTEYDLSFSQALHKKFISGETAGQSARFQGGSSDVKELIKRLDIKVVDEQNLANIKIIYGFSPRLGKPVIINNKKVNIHIAQRCAIITVGTPLILGSY